MNFELNITEKYKDETFIDEWGSAILTFEGNYGTEYNFCIDGGNCSAIYYFSQGKEDEYPQLRYDQYEHYEIDFEEGWQGRLLNEMIEVALIYRKFESQATE